MKNIVQFVDLEKFLKIKETYCLVTVKTYNKNKSGIKINQLGIFKFIMKQNKFVYSAIKKK